MQHNSSYTDGCYSFVNNITTPEGGTHLAGFKNALTKTFNEFARNLKYLKENESSLSGEDIREAFDGNYQYKNTGTSVRRTDKTKIR